MPRSLRASSISPGRGRSHPKQAKKARKEESEDSNVESEEEITPSRSTRSHGKSPGKLMPSRNVGRSRSTSSPDNKRRGRSDPKGPQAKKAKIQEKRKGRNDSTSEEEDEDELAQTPRSLRGSQRKSIQVKEACGKQKKKQEDLKSESEEVSDKEEQSKAPKGNSRNSISEEEKEEEDELAQTPRSLRGSQRKNVQAKEASGKQKKKQEDDLKSESSEVSDKDEQSRAPKGNSGNNTRQSRKVSIHESDDSDNDVVILEDDSPTSNNSDGSKHKRTPRELSQLTTWQDKKDEMDKALDWSGMTRTRGSKRDALDKMCVSVALNMVNGSDSYLDEDEEEVQSLSDSNDSDIQEVSSEEEEQEIPGEDTFRTEKSIQSIRSDYESRLAKQGETIQRLQNALSFKEEQLEELNSLATRNMELEARISYLLTDRKNYDKEMQEIERKNKEKKNAEERKRKADEDQEDEVEVVLVDSPEKKKPSRHAVDGKSGVEQKDVDSKRRKRGKRGSRKPKEKEEEGEDIDTYFVSDDEEDAEEKNEDDNKVKEKDEKKVEKKSVVAEPVESAVKEVSENDDSDEDKSGNKGRHNIRKLMANKKLKEETKAAAKAEKERRDRVSRMKEQHLVVTETDKKTKQPICTKLVLEFKKGTKTPLVEVNNKLVRKLKPHQVEAIEFLWDSVIESVDRLKSDEVSSGCILAHCMGLGKTLSVIALVHTLMTHKFLSFRTCLVVCPLNTVLNWKTEWTKWLDKKDRLKVYELASAKGNLERAQLLQKWKKEGGIMIMGYQIFRILASSTTRSKKRKEIFETSLINPGADMVVCDEGHVLKNDASSVSKCMNRIHSKRRIVLTGTPLQNNLVEYHCMVNFVKENLLGTRREFMNRFVNPITNGQHADSTDRDVKIMKRRAHVLHEMLAGCVQRRDYSALTKFLPPKYEYVLLVRLSPKQMELYQKYLDVFRGGGAGGTVPVVAKGAGLFQDFHNLMKVWTHPWVLKLDEIRQEKKALEYDSEDDLDSFIEDESEEETGSSPASEESDDDVKEVAQEEDLDNGKPTERRTRKTRSMDNKNEDAKKTEEKTNLKENGEAKSGDTDGTDERKKRRARIVAGEVIREWSSASRRKEGDSDSDIIFLKEKKIEESWWHQLVAEEDEKIVELSGKLVIMFEILRMAEGLSDKVLIFSQSILTLDIIEAFLSYRNEEAQKIKAKKGTFNKWERDEDYVRMDGSTAAQNRTKLTTAFNDTRNKRLRLFLISTRAGGLGINLDTANRVIIFDASWNPSHDIQSIFRAYRFGQVKPVYVYRLLAQGTMEEKIYERQVTKETLSQRVIDEQQLDRHFTAADLQELYLFTPDRLDDPDKKKRPTPKVPEDLVLAEMLSGQSDWLVTYHEHDSLLERRPEQDLTEEERQAAWEDYERDKNAVTNLYTRHPLQQQPLGLNLNYVPGRAQVPYNPMTGIPSTSGVAQAMANSLGEPHAKINFQIAQLPRVVQEILRYNPSITSQELHSRLQSFLGMHTKYGSVPAFALPAAEGLAAVNMAATSVLNSMAGNPSTSHPVTMPSITPWAGPSTSTSSAPRLTLSNQNMPTRLPMPGNVPGSIQKD